MKNCIIYVVRHGESTHNRDDVVSGHGNPGLTKTGEQQAKTLARELTHIKFDGVYTSDRQRAVRTAELITGRRVPKDHQLYELRERDFGLLEGKPGERWRKMHQAENYLRLTDEQRWTHKHLPDIESDHEISERYLKAIQKIAKRNPGKTILIAAHGGTLRTLIIKLGYATLARLPQGSMSNTSYAKIIYDGYNFRVQEVKGINKPPK